MKRKIRKTSKQNPSRERKIKSLYDKIKVLREKRKKAGMSEQLSEDEAKSLIKRIIKK